MSSDPFCPEHGHKPSAYTSCSCRDKPAPAGRQSEALVARGLARNLFAELPIKPPTVGHPVEIALVPAESAVRVVGIPDTTAIPPEVMRGLAELARACRDAYGMGVEVEAQQNHEAAVLAVETLRRYLG